MPHRNEHVAIDLRRSPLASIALPSSLLVPRRRSRTRQPIRCPPGTTARPSKSIIDFVDKGNQGRRSRISCRRPSASPRSTMTARCGPSSRCISSSSSPSTASRRWRRSIRSGRTKEPFASLLKGDVKGALAGRRDRRIVEIVMATHAGMTTDGVRARSSRTGSPPRSIPRPSGLIPRWSISRCSNCSPTCGPTASRPSSSPAAASSSCAPGRKKSTASRPSRSSAAASRRNSRCATASPVLVRLPEFNFIDDKAGKPVGINQHIGRRPIAAFGNSDGDQQMLEWTQAAAVRADDAGASRRRGTRVCLRPGVEDRHLQRCAHGEAHRRRAGPSSA